MSRHVGLKMACAAKADLDVAMDLCRWLNELSGGFEPPLQEGDDQPPFDQDDDAACGRVLRRMLERAEQGSLMRVVWGMATVLNPENKVLDLDADVLQPHPDIAAAADELEEVAQALGRWKPLTASVGAAVNELVNELKAAAAEAWERQAAAIRKVERCRKQNTEGPAAPQAREAEMEGQQQKPSIGRIVHVRGITANGSDTHPAIITRVWSDTCVNVTVFHDFGPPESRTSLNLLDEPPSDEDLARNGGLVAFWPPRV